MSKKSRKSAPRRPGSTAAVPSSDRRAGLRDLTPRQDLAEAGTREGSPAIPVAALVVTTLLIGAYLHLLVLEQMTQLSGGLAMPDSLIGGYSREHVAALAAVMDESARGQLNWVHKTAGVIFPVAVALTVSVVGAWRLRPAGAKLALLGLGVVFAVVDIAENVAIESAIAAAGDGAGLASALTVTRWVLLAVIVLVTAVLLLFGGRGRRSPASTAR